ncbi:cobyrinate a,c-diamide synthase [Aestuariispira insulae]|nr:cobyrinate a,c-diamide synthase [Aestuariispira insulae]
MKGLVIAAPSSGSGKTLVTLALLRALKNRGCRVASAKTGPDYIDPAFHSAASGRPCRNLDPWAMRVQTISHAVHALAEGADLIVAEGVMGLFDGARDGTGSTADLAVMLGWPVVLVVDVKGQAASAAAMVQGFARFRTDLRLSGVIFNRVGGKGHVDILSQAMAEHLPEIPVLGFLPKQADLVMPERHLGLVQAVENADLDHFLEQAAEWAGAAVDLDRLVAIATAADLVPGNEGPLPPLGQRIAVAKDEAFAFTYQEVLDGWRQAGAEISFFSPLADEAPDGHADAIYLPGGYPELHAGCLAGNQNFMNGLQSAAARRAFVFGECGGYMTLGQGLVDAEGQRHEMAGLLPLETSFQKRRLHLGYRKAVSLSDSPLGRTGQYWRGHEFHYASIVEEGAADRLFRMRDALDQSGTEAGLKVNSVAGSFLHLIDRADD